MVYHGPSKGCNSCRVRRKKCDEGRPSCMRCIKANRPCGGYEHGDRMIYRQYEAQGPTPQPTIMSWARQCSLPKRVPLPGTNILPDDLIPLETSQAESEMLGFRCFLFDYGMVSTNQNLSRSYLPDLDALFRQVGFNSDLVKACRAVSFASRGKGLNRPAFIAQGERAHQEILTSLAKIIAYSNANNAAELKRVVMLLGLYQMIMADETNYSSIDAHADGFLALVSLGKSAGSLTFNPDNKFLGVFSPPALNIGGAFDSLLVDFHILSERVNACQSLDQLRLLVDEAIELEDRFKDWESSRSPEFRPSTAGHVTPATNYGEPAVGRWPGKVDSYFDLYVSGVWNTFRGARLLLISMIIDLSSNLGDGKQCVQQYITRGTQIAEDMAGSVLFHLADNPQTSLMEKDTASDIKHPGRFLGGFLLMYPMYTACQTSYLPKAIRSYFRRCLRWIGSDMGIGMATVLATVDNIDRHHLTCACIIIWSGFIE
ncbi:hypothetical protein V2G26_002689 [Clonostachys chloroleuca]|uniref:Zn(2)-C6 fungal-type domain-containing protein n=1 Tax=Clonostachys chloroleuca TaxID=1926264 RepID=A0AA35M529_9HYPO|nr:unnamed protein product [Clonostachys chloroleuca]